jgi:hypothetical protein
MYLKYLRFALVLITTSAATISAQEPRCTVKHSDLPAIQELRGFRLGMTMAEVLARSPKSAIKPADHFGFTTVDIFPDYAPGIDKSTYDGVRTVSIELLDGRVSSLWIGYDKSFKWQTLDEFTVGMTAALKLPNGWRSRFRNRVMDCADFSLAVVPVGDSPSIKLVDDAARELLDKRKTAAEAVQP